MGPGAGKLVGVACCLAFGHCSGCYVPELPLSPPSCASVVGRFFVCLQGRDGAAALFDKLKVGAVVALSGRVQQHPQPAAGADPGRHRHVIDVVVSEIRVLHKSR